MSRAVSNLYPCPGTGTSVSMESVGRDNTTVQIAMVLTIARSGCKGGWPLLSSRSAAHETTAEELSTCNYFNALVNRIGLELF